MSKTKIEWTDETDNVIVVMDDDGKPHGWYCQKISPGCTNCYAESVNGNSFYNGNGLKYRVPADGKLPTLMLREDILAGWARKSRPRRRFVNSMTDTFGEFVPEEWIFRILDAMTAAPAQTFQVLTKRAERAKIVADRWLEARGLQMLPHNIWMGVSVENQEWADKRIPHLLQISAEVRFLSMEPLLGEVDLDVWLGELPEDEDGAPYPGEGLQWVIAGGESGHNARPCHPDWVRLVRDLCQEAGVPFFFKQWGEWYPDRKGIYGKAPSVMLGNTVMHRLGKSVSGRLLDGREWNEFPMGEMRR